MSDAASATQPQSFGRYRVTKTLGRGAMGEVYAATDEVLGREVAIKTLRGASGAAARFIDERFRNEARAIAQLTHPGVVQVFDVDVTANPPYLVMERVAGPALSDRIAEGPLSPADLVPLGIQIANALAAAHAVNVVHRDVKPSNILGAGPGTWKLADFGVAHVPDSSLTMTGQFVGSPAYASPEALIKGVSAPAGDVYGLGATLYEAATGTWPRAEASGALLAPVPPVRERAPHLPAHIAAAIDRACSLEAAQRPTAAELAHMIAGAQLTPQPGATSTPPHGAAISQPGATSTPPHGTQHGAASMSQHGAAATAVPTRGPLRWKPWAIAGAIVLVLLLFLATRGDKKPSAAAAPGGFPGAEVPDHIEANPPSGMDRKMAKDWGKLIEALQRQDWPAARDHLDEFEHKYGESDESSSLRSQLDRLPPELFERGGPGGHGRGRREED